MQGDAKMKIAGMNITYRYYPFEVFLDSMAALGIEAIELWGGAPHFYTGATSTEKIRQTKEAIRARGLELCCFTPEQCAYSFNIAAADAELRASSVDYFIASLHAAVELEAPLMLVTSGLGYFSEKDDEPWQRSADSLAQIACVAEREGITLALEPLTHFESNIVTDLAGLKRMQQLVGSPALKGMLDTVAMHLAHETVSQYIEELGADFVHFHLIDGDGTSDAHLAPGDGVLPLADYLEALKQAQYTGFITLEVMSGDYVLHPHETLKRSYEYLKQL
jgi:protein FrlC